MLGLVVPWLGEAGLGILVNLCRVLADRVGSMKLRNPAHIIGSIGLGESCAFVCHDRVGGLVPLCGVPPAGEGSNEERDPVDFV